MSRNRWDSILVWALLMTVILGQGAWAQMAPLVSQYGVFAQSGDGGDLPPNGKAAPIIPAGTIPWLSPQPCGLQWIADNPKGYAPDPPPSVIHFTRSFRLSPDLVHKGTFTLSFKADDQVEFFLNGESVAVASCTPPPGDDGECQKYCHTAVIAGSKFLPEPQVNTLKIDLINLHNVRVGRHYGWTSLSYSLGVKEASGLGGLSVHLKDWRYVLGILAVAILGFVVLLSLVNGGTRKDPDNNRF